MFASLRRRSGLPGLVLALALVLAGCGEDSEAAPQQGAQGAGAGRGGPGGAGGGRPAVVETAAVQPGDIARVITVSGVVEPIRTIGVNSQLSGALLSVRVEEGTMVREGQVLAQIDDRELASQEALAVANFNVARAALARAEPLRERQFITAAEYERERTAFAAAEAQLEQIRTRRGYAVVRAPLSGIVLQKLVEAGDVVGQQTRLFNIGDVSVKVVRAGVSELDIGNLSAGMQVNLVLDALPGRPLAGRIRRIFPSADPATRLVPVEIALEGEAGRVARPGFLARVSLPVGSQRGVLLVPASAVQGAQGSQTVFVVEDGTARRRSVETGAVSGGRVQIVSGLSQGEIVVVTGANAVRDGGSVRVVGAGASAAASQAANTNTNGRGE